MAAVGTARSPPPQERCVNAGTAALRPPSLRLQLVAFLVVVAALSSMSGAASQQNFRPGMAPLLKRNTGPGASMPGRLNPSLAAQSQHLSARRQSAPALVDAAPSTAAFTLGPGAAEGPGAGAGRPLRPDAVAPAQRPPAPVRPTANWGGQRGSGDIVFPDNDASAGGRRPPPPPPPPPASPPPPAHAVPLCARGGATFCEDADNYPANHLSQALENTVAFAEFFGNDSMPQTVSARVGDRIAGEMTLCPSEERLVFPKIGQNEKDEWIFIVNLDNEYKQGIRIEMCKNERQPCLLSSNFPSGTTVTCRQKYVYRKLLAVSDVGEPQPDSFRMPSCCACFVDNAVLGSRSSSGRKR